MADARPLAEKLDRLAKPKWRRFGVALHARRMLVVWRLALSALGARPLSAEDEKYLHLALEGSAVRDLDTPEEFFTAMQAAGFRELDYEVRTDQIDRSLRKLYYFAILTLPIALVAHRLGLMSKVLADGSISNYYQREATRRKLVPYLVLSARKP